MVRKLSDQVAFRSSAKSPAARYLGLGTGGDRSLGGCFDGSHSAQRASASKGERFGWFWMSWCFLGCSFRVFFECLKCFGGVFRVGYCLFLECFLGVSLDFLFFFCFFWFESLLDLGEDGVGV